MKAKDKKHVFVTKLFYTVSGSVTPLVGMGETIWTDSEKMFKTDNLQKKCNIFQAF